MFCVQRSAHRAMPDVVHSFQYVWRPTLCSSARLPVEYHQINGYSSLKRFLGRQGSALPVNLAGNFCAPCKPRQQHRRSLYFLNYEKSEAAFVPARPHGTTLGVVTPVLISGRISGLDDEGGESRPLASSLSNVHVDAQRCEGVRDMDGFLSQTTQS